MEPTTGIQGNNGSGTVRESSASSSKEPARIRKVVGPNIHPGSVSHPNQAGQGQITSDFSRRAREETISATEASRRSSVDSLEPPDWLLTESPPRRPSPPRPVLDKSPPRSSDPVRRAYTSNRLLHGTTQVARASIRENGFISDRKTRGAVETALRGGNFSDDEQDCKLVENAKVHHYFTSDHGIAKYFAGVTSPTPDQRAIVRLLAPQEGLGHDPDVDRSADEYRHIWRTAASIGPTHVIESKRSPAGLDADAFQRALEKEGVLVSVQEAGRLLRDVQSDSEDDFRVR